MKISSIIMSKIDDLDIKIIRELKKDARQSYREIADRLGVAEGTVYNRVNKLRELGVIKGFIPDIDYSKLGYDLVVLIGVIVEGGYLLEIEREIAGEPNVSAVYDVTGEYDAIIVARFRDRASLNDFVKRILAMQHVRRTYTMLVLNVMKGEYGIEI
ncbi:Lrp/AsnC family transcriptional regulator [Candidatus Hakubella thermalkaliphila]|uniref:Lrp/AsnC family transcriptional regulator n=1 Tax=Candidatus Hakubella thermalkaliphila TaxID=2754717 RepID=A0A6V8NWV8_9ACTN|nr:Lrp/AsnC family transcriptional regulator [Candidatus Hakubella thermalkaliphila]MBT9169611.1 Regulatory protein AsnC [Bacillota bacterium]GFP18915.1 Lrp/AsnC family transcriptional regulator [Candidatus Hakubella thermalkaliphila]GFP22996.1 Lrp/AsnC family transcriptional regulator [Candidatus Hakubella thermalkaliphila]GFP30999.1 Lrp/AsnC family transcriptional regulator [Candidatus Hakubella thermalkaliphila]GFP40186.1 Lrp/AsnC family transcriptional regulator [Candidatus Hakubella therm